MGICFCKKKKPHSVIMASHDLGATINPHRYNSQSRNKWKQ